MSNKNTIELNGKQYDALTGALLSQKQHIDGFVTAKPRASVSAQPTARPKPADRLASRPTSKSKAAHRPNPHPGRRAAHSTTLMRSSVQKPPASKPVHHIHAPSDSAPAKRLSETPAAARASINERRLAHSRLVNYNPSVQRFKTTIGDIRPVVSEKIQAKVNSLNAERSQDKPSAKTIKTSQDKLDKLLASGLEQSASHEQPLLSKAPKSVRKSHRTKRKVRPLVAIGILAVIAIAIAGIVFYQFLPRLDLSIAANKAGVHATLPSYRPPGYGMVTPIKYGSGTLTINYRQKSSGRQFSLTEQNSGWDSQTLLDSFVVPADPNYQTLNKDSQTFYLYDQHDLTWVNGNLWYQITGNASLSQNQLLDIASSL